MSTVERRQHARISTILDAQIEVGMDQVMCRVRDLSLGGALVECDLAKIALKQNVVLMLPPVAGRSPVPVPGTCARFNVEAGTVRYGLKFAAELPDRAGLISWLRVLGESSQADAQYGQRRASPRVRRRLEVSIFGSSQCRAVLDDISRGGMSYHCRDAIAVGEQVTVELVSPFGALTLTGEVTRSENTDVGNGGAVVFSSPSSADPAVRRWLDRLLVEEASEDT
jgi:c-di-GMP-binding flagellar brake protein YcgR